MDDRANKTAKLNLRNVIGLKGQIPGGFIVHSDLKHVIYTLGCAVIVENLETGKQDVLQGHSMNVICIAVSPCGKYIASGQSTHMGFKADIILWDYATRHQISTFPLHKVRVMSLCFSANSKYLVSLGGQDDGCVVVWSMEKRIAICGSQAQSKSAGVTKVVVCANNDDDVFVTAGDNSIRVWTIEAENRKIRPVECKLGPIKRLITSAVIAKNDNFFYCGTTSGDILIIGLASGFLSSVVPEKEKFSLGITSLALIQDKALIVGAGDGTLQEFSICYKSDKSPKLIREAQKSATLFGSVTAISPRGHGHQFFVTTAKCHLYRFNYGDYKAELITTCHYSPINDVKFPHNCSDLFVTCGYEDVRVYHVDTKKELLRINIPNMTCFSVDILHNGCAVVSGWNDSKIRGFYPESGRLMYTIHDAHKKGVTALASTSDGCRIVSGGGEGLVRVWEVTEHRAQVSSIPYSRKMRKSDLESSYVTHLVATMKEHANAVSSIQINKNDTACVSSSADGTCIVWCLETFRRKQIIFANTLFRAVAYHPEECQILTTGTDRKVGYWELYDGASIRELDGSKSGSVNGLDMSPNGEFFVTGGDDRLIKLWKYHEGEVFATGTGHSSAISRVRIAPNQKFVVTVCEDGGIFIWDIPASA